MQLAFIIRPAKNIYTHYTPWIKRGKGLTNGEWLALHTIIILAIIF